ncbi:RING/U-box superfamily protein [Raphanus sativus]|uniref:RING-type E3 ubiquitin transferase n=1 Tax=Raphanus sativus TaxID=3726 RepID=A0A6J0LWB9_RAPSA|nr:RING-H2 finger protein ATL40-like [Raphanus sativus]KAJ4903561.1 RING/U-box superfamily protein [Raphanus sativus]
MSFNDPSLNSIILWFAAVTSLLTIFVIFILLVIFLVKRRRFVDVSPETENEHHRRRELQGKGHSASVIASFSTFSYKQDNNDLESNSQEIECPVCLGLIPKNAVIKVLPNCKHMFDEECIGRWLESHTTCPVCRTMAEPMASTSADKVLESIV